VPIGPQGGSGQVPGSDDLVTAEFAAQAKGRDMMVDRVAALLGTGDRTLTRISTTTDRAKARNQARDPRAALHARPSRPATRRRPSAPPERRDRLHRRNPAVRDQRRAKHTGRAQRGWFGVIVATIYVVYEGARAQGLYSALIRDL
jgi:hypothetical protein